MRHLCVDTSGARTVLAIGEGTAAVGEAVLTGDGHSEKLIDAIQGLLVARGWALADLDGYGIVLGPGSFTGLRVGLATLKGFGAALPRPTVGLDALDLLVAQAPAGLDAVAAVRHARKGKVFAAAYRRAGDGWTRLAPPIETDPASFHAAHPVHAFVGDAPLRQPALFDGLPVAPGAEHHPSPATLCRAAYARHARGERLDLATVEPHYVSTLEFNPGA